MVSLCGGASFGWSELVLISLTCTVILEHVFGQPVRPRTKKLLTNWSRFCGTFSPHFSVSSFIRSPRFCTV